jgi:hypothetical protein
MLRLQFEGFFQCRLATDPDPADESRGVSGWTFAVAPEPDLDRVIRLQDPVAVRFPGPTVGVTVKRATRHGDAAPDHPLVGARVNLLDAPKFEGRSGIVAEDAQEPIDPFLLEIVGGGITLRREDFWNRRLPQRLPIADVNPVDLARRQPVRDNPVSVAEVFEAVGVTTPPAFLSQRRQGLDQVFASLQVADQRAGIQKRMADLDFVLGNLQQGIGDIRLGILGASLVYRFEINGPGAVVEDPRGLLGGMINPSPPWPVTFWMGGFDADALCGFMRGNLDLPFQPNPEPELT